MFPVYAGLMADPQKNTRRPPGRERQPIPGGHHVFWRIHASQIKWIRITHKGKRIKKFPGTSTWSEITTWVHENAKTTGDYGVAGVTPEGKAIQNQRRIVNVKNIKRQPQVRQVRQVRQVEQVKQVKQVETRKTMPEDNTTAVAQSQQLTYEFVERRIAEERAKHDILRDEIAEFKVVVKNLLEGREENQAAKQSEQGIAAVIQTLLETSKHANDALLTELREGRKPDGSQENAMALTYLEKQESAQVSRAAEDRLQRSDERERLAIAEETQRRIHKQELDAVKARAVEREAELLRRLANNEERADRHTERALERQEKAYRQQIDFITLQHQQELAALTRRTNERVADAERRADERVAVAERDRDYELRRQRDKLEKEFGFSSDHVPKEVQGEIWRRKLDVEYPEKSSFDRFIEKVEPMLGKIMGMRNDILEQQQAPQLPGTEVPADPDAEALGADVPLDFVI